MAAAASGDKLLKDAAWDALEGTLKGTYTLLDAENLDQGGLSEDALGRYKAIQGKPIYFQLAFSGAGVRVIAEYSQGVVQEFGTLPAASLHEGSYSVSLETTEAPRAWRAACMRRKARSVSAEGTAYPRHRPKGWW